MFAKTPEPPYYAVIFTSILQNNNGYSEIAEEMDKLVKTQDGFLGYESARNELGITVSYWRDLESIKNWKNNSRHLSAQQNGRTIWYQSYKVRICLVERDYDFAK